MGHGPHLKGKSMDINNIIKQTIEELAKHQKRSISAVSARYSAFEARLRNVAIREMAKEDLAKLEQGDHVADGGKMISASTERVFEKRDWGTLRKAAEKEFREEKVSSTTGYIMVPSSFASVSQREAYIEGLDKECSELSAANSELHASIDRNIQAMTLAEGRKLLASHTPTFGDKSVNMSHFSRLR